VWNTKELGRPYSEVNIISRQASFQSHPSNQSILQAQQAPLPRDTTNQSIKMKFSIAAAALLSVAASAAPTSYSSSSDDVTFAIKDFTERKHDGVNINSVFFNISATNDGTLNFECDAYDPVTDGLTESFEAGHVYTCGKNSFFSFSFTPSNGNSTNELFLWQDVTDTKALGGRVCFDDPICHAGGSLVNDSICSQPPQVPITIDMHKLG
jgi:hypothetical protein